MISLSDFLELNLPPRKLILDPWLPQQGLAMIYAPRGIGKTFCALYIAYAIASGGEVFKWKAPEARKVLYIDGEMPQVTMQERLAKIVSASKKHPPDASYFGLITPDRQQAGIRDLNTQEGRDDIYDHLEGIEVIFLDNLSALVRSGKENEAESWVSIQGWALSLRKEGKTVVFIHHAGKNGAQRGTSKKEDVLDTVIALRSPKGYSSAEGARFEVHFEKSRGFYGKDADPFEASLIANEDGKQEWSLKELEGRDLERVIELHLEGYSQRRIAEEMGKSLGWVNAKLKQAQSNGLIPKKEKKSNRLKKNYYEKEDEGEGEF